MWFLYWNTIQIWEPVRNWSVLIGWTGTETTLYASFSWQYEPEDDSFLEHIIISVETWYHRYKFLIKEKIQDTASVAKVACAVF